jgi:transcriptional regulator with XRE-family HTH domain
MTREDWMENFGENLLDILGEKKIKQRELSELTGIATSTISDYINGKTIPSAIAVLNISYALDVDCNDLVDFGDIVD